MTGEQIRAARAMLRLDQRQFAAMAHVTLSTLQRIERTRGEIKSPLAIVEALRHALEAVGVELIEAGSYTGTGGPGLRLKGEVVAGDTVIDLEKELATGRPDEIVAHQGND